MDNKKQMSKFSLSYMYIPLLSLSEGTQLNTDSFAYLVHKHVATFGLFSHRKQPKQRWWLVVSSIKVQNITEVLLLIHINK